MYSSTRAKGADYRAKLKRMTPLELPPRAAKQTARPSR